MATQLLTPGPVPVPDFVREAMAQPVIHHRTEAFESFYAQLQSKLRYFFQTDNLTGTFLGSGTYGVEMAMQSFFRPGDKVLILDFGKFSGRWVDHGKWMGLEAIPLAVEWGHSPSLNQVLEAAEPHPDLAGVVFTHSETSTGAVIDLEEMAFALRRSHPEALLLVDAITSVGAIPFYHDDWGLDVSITASQKALMNPAGVVALALSAKAEGRLKPTHHGDFGNLYNFAQQARKHNYPFTPPVSLLFGLDAALTYIQSQTLPTIWNETHQAASLFRKGLEAFSAEVFPQQASDSLTAFSWPEHSPSVVRKRLIDEQGLELSGGQGELKDKILRVSHMGIDRLGLMRKLLSAMNQI